MKKKRQAEILKLISTFEIETQEMLLYLLKERGYNVTQATVSRDINELNLEKAISSGAGRLCERIELFDVYEGAQIPEGKKSVAFNLTLRADDRSLTAQEADEDVKSILTLLESELNAVLR